MNKRISAAIIAASLAWIGADRALAQSMDERLSFSLEASAEYTDNRDSAEDAEKESTWDYTVAPRVEYVFSWQRTFFELMYRPSYRYRTNPAENQNDEEWLHDANIQFFYESGRRLSLRLNDRFSYTDDPEIQFGEDIERPNQSFYFNRFSGGAVYNLGEITTLDIEGGYDIKRYDEAEAADYSDEDLLSLTARLQRQQRRDTTLSALFRYTAVGRENADELDRDFETFAFGAGVRYIFSSFFTGELDGGYQIADYSAKEVDDAESPFVNAKLNYYPTELTGLFLGGAYSIVEAYSYPFISQNRTYFYGGIDWEPNRRIKFGFQGEYRIEDYETEYIDPATPEGAYIKENSGETTMVIGSAWVDFRLRKGFTLQLRHSIQDTDSDVNTSFTRNATRVSLSKIF